MKYILQKHLMPIALAILLGLSLLGGCGDSEPSEGEVSEQAEADSSAQAAEQLDEAKKLDTLNAAKDSLFNMPDSLNRFFKKYGVTGSFVLFDPQKGTYSYHDAKRSAAPFIPGDGFLPILGLMALESGALPDTATILTWSGEPSGNEDWDKSQALGEALQYRTPWFFEELARKTGRKRIQDYLNQLDYGNRAVGAGTFWKNGKLTINLQDQITLLRGIYRESLPFSPKNMAFVKRYAFEQKDTEYYRMTTMNIPSSNSEAAVAWHTGYLIFEGEVPKGYYFSGLVDADREDALQVIESISKEILKDSKLL